jgi:hypothetical protein
MEYGMGKCEKAIKPRNLASNPKIPVGIWNSKCSKKNSLDLLNPNGIGTRKIRARPKILNTYE